MVLVIVRVINIQYGDVVPATPFVSETDGDMPTRLDSIEPKRGRILSCQGKELVSSVPHYDLHMDLSIVKDDLFNDNVDSLAWNLSQIFPDKSKNEWEVELRQEREDGNQYFLIRNDVDYDILKQVDQFPILRESKFKGGFIVEEYFKREKPWGSLANRTLGSKREGAMAIGLEGAFDKELTGEYGLQTKQWVNNGWKPVGTDYVRDPINGADIVTSIDIFIQEVAENELKRQLVEQNAVHGSVVLMEVETGFIKAIANLKKGEDGGYYELYNHAIGTRTDPGSTFKLASLMALLEDGKADITDTVKAYGAYHFYDHTIEDSHEGGYGRITLQHAFEVSSNVFSKVINDAYRNDPQQYVDRIKSFGIGDTLGIDIAGEPFPIVKNQGEDGWSGITLPQMAIGYEVEITPLQTLAFYNAVANNGELVKPQFVERIEQDGEVLKRFEKVVLKDRICSETTLEKVKICLEGVVERGTGRNLKSANFQIAGKTGTAKLVDVAAGTYSNQYQASFAGYFPADKPKYSCIVVIAGPTKQIYGAQVSGTVFTAIADKVYSSSWEYHDNYNLTNPIAKSQPRVKYGDSKETAVALKKLKIAYNDQSQGADWVAPVNTDEGLQLKSRQIQDGQVPNVLGMPLNDAVFLLENAGLRVKVNGHGRVVSQSINSGRPITEGEAITLVLK